MNRKAKQLGIGIGLAAIITSTGCNDLGSDSVSPRDQIAAKPPSQWRVENNALVAGVPNETTDAELAAAMAQARATAEAARMRWRDTELEDRMRWSVKWASPTIADNVEHVWVLPVNWSPFRVEGTLASQPVAELLCGKTVGEMVSFPVEELSDWIHFADETVAGDSAVNYEGGFTVKVLSARFGTPP